jgi:hypothetical protein
MQDINVRVYQPSVFVTGTHWLVIAKHLTILHLQNQYVGQSRSPEWTTTPYLCQFKEVNTDKGVCNYCYSDENEQNSTAM